LSSNLALKKDIHLVREEEMVGMKWLDLKNEKRRTMDTYMDTKAL